MKKKTTRANAAPLLSWDVFIETIQRREYFSEDIAAIKKLGKAARWRRLERSVENALIWENSTILITKPTLEIVYATRNLAAMTGYVPEEVIGRTPKMFQGAETGEAERARIREALNAEKPFEVTIVNYKKDGSTYACHVEAYPVFNQKKELVHFIAFEKAA